MPDTTTTSAARREAPLRFGPSGRFELQPGERRLLIDARPARLGARAFDLLLALSARPDQLLTKAELLDQVWPGLIVEEANLQVQISSLRKLLGGDVIATVPGRGYRFTGLPAFTGKPDLAGAPPLPQASGYPAAPSAAPQRLFGRDADLKRLERLLHAGEPCVTVVGPAGVGKTSLARTAAARWTAGWAWVDLAALPPGSSLTDAVARSLGLQLGGGLGESRPDATAPLLRALDGQALLLVLDNAEHLIDHCADLVTRLRSLTRLQMLVTSQLPLAVAGEQVHRLEPLDLTLPTPITGLGDGAMALLVERIVAADHRFNPAPATLALLSTICVQLDGLPLALEMAAARVPLMGVQGVHDALVQRFALLTRGHRDADARHRSLHHAMDWSYRLLSAAEQRLFCALGVFSGGFTLDLAVALITDELPARWDVIEGLATLVDRSLVVVSNDEPPRYRLLQTPRAFALEQLAQMPQGVGDEQSVRRRHAVALLALFERHKPGDAQATRICESEMANVREALSWAQVHDLSLAVRLSARAAVPAVFTVWRHESGNWLLALRPLMQQAAGLALSAEVQADWWTVLARALVMRTDPRAAATARHALALWQPLQRADMALAAAIVWVRALAEPGPELDQACAELQTLAAESPELPAVQQLALHGALVKAARIRGDLEAVLAGRLAEVQLALALDKPVSADAAESNVVNALNMLGRHAEAAQRGRALLARIEGNGNGNGNGGGGGGGSGSGDGGGGGNNGSASNGNVPWVFSGLLASLDALGLLAEAQALAPRAWTAGQRFGTPVVLPPLTVLAAAQRRFEAAALLVGYTLQCFAAGGTQPDHDDRQLLDKTQALATTELGAAAVDAAVARGRWLTVDAAAALAAGPT